MARTVRLDLTQSTAPTPGQPDKAPLAIPVILGFVSPDGGDVPVRHERLRADGLFMLEAASDSLTFADAPEGAVPSLLRGFSAPVKLALDLSAADHLSLLRHDPDPFNRWQAAQALVLGILVRLGRSELENPDPELDAFAAGLDSFLTQDGRSDPAYAALILALPGETEIAQHIGADVDPDAIHDGRELVRARLGRALRDTLMAIRADFPPEGSYSPDAASAGRRALANAALDLLAAGDPGLGVELASPQFAEASNMTDRLAALATLCLIPGGTREAALEDFAARYAEEPLVLDKWLGLQAAIPEPDTLDRVRRLMSHAAFSFANPNRVRALLGSFAVANQTQFHRRDRAGYALLTEAVLGLNGSNPQVAARLLTAFSTWRNLERDRREGAEAALRRIIAAPSLSPDVADIVGRSLAAS